MVNVAGMNAESTGGPLPGYLFCNICNENIREEYMAEHENSQEHLRRKLSVETFTYAQSDKFGIKVSHLFNGVDFGTVDTDAPSRILSRSMILTVKKTEPNLRISLKTIQFSSYMPKDGSEDR